MSILPNFHSANDQIAGYPTPDPFGLSSKGQQLSSAFARLDRPSVLAVDGSWGVGKTFFLKCWEAAEKDRIKIVYYDAFEHDYLDDPLTSLLLAVSKNEVAKGKSWKKLKKAAKPLARAGALAALNVVTVGATRELGELGAAATDALGDTAQQSVEQWWAKEKGKTEAMGAFREHLKSMIAENAEADYVVLVVDELDRCRPDYAIRVLETIKHFFTVSGVHFLLGVNLEQLQHSLGVVYGRGFDAKKYLQRFIHATMELEGGSARQGSAQRAADYLNRLCDDDDNRWLSEVVSWIPRGISVPLRDMERLHTLGKLVRVPNSYAEADFQAALMVLKVVRPDLFDGLRSGKPNVAGVRSFFGIGSGGDFWLNISSERAEFSAHLLYALQENVEDEVRARYGLSELGYNSFLDETVFERLSSFRVP